MTPQDQAGTPAPQPGWFSRNWKWVVPVGCGLPLLCCGVFSAGAYFMAAKVIQGTPVFAEAVQKANANPEVTAALGQPVAPGFMLSGEVKESTSGGMADFTFPLEGPKGKGSLHAVASEKGGQWTFDALTVDLGGGRVVDLLAGEAPAEADVPDSPPDIDAPPLGEPMPEEDVVPPPEGDGQE